MSGMGIKHVSRRPGSFFKEAGELYRHVVVGEKITGRYCSSGYCFNPVFKNMPGAKYYRLLDISMKDICPVFVSNLYGSCIDAVCHDLEARVGILVDCDLCRRTAFSAGHVKFSSPEPSLVKTRVLNAHVQIGMGTRSDMGRCWLVGVSWPQSMQRLIMAVCFVTLFHEAEHVVQHGAFQDFDSPIDDIIYMAVNDLACVGNTEYYGSADYDAKFMMSAGFNYYTNPTEICAEQVGVMDTYEYLCSVFPDRGSEWSEQLVLDYVNRCVSQQYFVKRPLDGVFTDIRDVDAAFDAAFEASTSCQRMYGMDQPDDDPVRDFIRSNPDILRRFLAPCNHGYNQDKIVAAVNLYLHPEYLSLYPVLRTVDLSLDSVLRMSDD